MSTPYRISTLACVILLGVLAASPVLGDALWAPYGEEGVTLVKAGGAWHEIRSEKVGSEKALPLSPNARVDHLAASGDSWWAAAVEAADGEDRMVLLRGNAQGVETIPAPTVELAEVILQPRLLFGEAGPEMIVWIEGETHQTTRVRAARRSESGWAQPTTIADKGPGTQIALQATELADGSFLAVWAAYDGEDDEIVWTRFHEGAWSRPTALTTNDVPDVTPALRALEGGALLAWSTFDGKDYRLLTAAFHGEGWTPGQRFGKRGSVFPTFAAGDVPLLVFQQTAPRTWVVSELDFRARVLRSTSVPYRAQRPLVTGRDARGAQLRWVEPGAEKATVASETAAWEMSVD